MKILYVTIKDKTKQGDFQEVMCLRALRSVLGDHCVDYPKKKILYNDFSEVSRESLHGKGFTLYDPVQDVSDRSFEDVDVVLYGYVNKNGYVNDTYPEVEALNKPTFFIDGHDDADVVVRPCFKHERFEDIENVYPLWFSIPSSKIREIDLSKKDQLIQKTAPPFSRFGPQVLGIPGRQLYIFEDEESYYDDMARSWFGLTCRKGSWDSLRHLEIIASGSLLLFRDLDKKPQTASPLGLPAPSYSTPQELQAIVERLLPDGKVSSEYVRILNEQREWLLNTATDEVLGNHIVSTLQELL